MALVTWDQSYSVKVASCDSEHQQLFALINQLHDAMKSGQGKTVLAGVVRELEKYTQTHFLAEEALMQRTQYSGLNEQRLLHQKFVSKVKEFRENLEKGVTSDSVNVLMFLKDWLANHILKTDKMYAAHLNANGIH
jgi:hemerythrin-like metal-binding protein